jgi:phosphohistidine phosphatase
MRVYLVQHGKAKSAEEDPDQNLSPEGQEDARSMGQAMCTLGVSVALIQHSGKKRAEQTAHIFAEMMRSASGPARTQDLGPGDDPAMTANFLNVYTDDMVVVGHLPHLERLASLLLTGNPDRRIVQMKNAGVVCLEKAGGTWSLLWAITPELLKKVRGAAAQ